ncbi:large conductance mechanosensitive channel protein MscL [Longitalea luteola]|uniref:large conductance mechanosensitive channel protein MscL n=1 Tax=Longitalea luteola TaxID=2812563 RepID=UPI001A97038C|nr:large conductance mechanosensitive channel protein MscL [Longitalea luteola]
MGMMKEFKEFAIKGNMVELAIAVIIGAAFSKIISSLVDDVITPLLLKPALEAANLQDLDKLVIFGTVKVGVFLSAVLNFLIVAFILFLLIKGINRFKRKEEAAAPVTPEEIILLREIRDALKK